MELAELEQRVDELHKAISGILRTLQTLGATPSEKPRAYHRVARLIALKEYVENHPGMKRRELAEQFEVSIRTIDRDIRTLEYAGVPIFCTGTGPDDGYRMLDDRSLG